VQDKGVLRAASMKRWVFVVALLAEACSPPCRSVCRKVLFECGDLDSQRVALDECEVSCQQQEILYEIWEDEEKQDLFDDHKRCIRSSSCDELAQGECYYDEFEDIFVF
jgi:hypothetical protein